MSNDYLFEEIKNVSLSMFRKNFFGIYHGSISAKIDAGKFIINKKDALFDEIKQESLINISMNLRDYKWNTASLDTAIHEQIYKDIPSAKYIAYTMPPYVVAYSLRHQTLDPSDYFGNMKIGKIKVYDPGNFNDWYDRAPYEIGKYFKDDSCQLMLVKGYGLIVYDRDIIQMVKKVALIENSARLIMLGELC